MLRVCVVQVCLGFYEKKSEKKGFWSFAGPKEEKVYWERWIMPISIAPNAGKNQAGQSETQAHTGSERETHSAVRSGTMVRVESTLMHHSSLAFCFLSLSAFFRS